MGRLPQLVDALAKVDERPRKRLEYLARTVRETGDLPTTKRGAGASIMTTRDAANFLIAASVAEHAPKNATMFISLYRELQVSQFIQHEKGGTVTDLAHQISATPNFGEALETIIATSPVFLKIATPKFDRNVFDWLESAPLPLAITQACTSPLTQMVARLEVTFVRPTANVQVRFMRMHEEDVRFLQIRSDRDHPICEWTFGSAVQTIGHTDATSSRTVGMRTLMNLFLATTDDDAIVALAHRYEFGHKR